MVLLLIMLILSIRYSFIKIYFFCISEVMRISIVHDYHNYEYPSLYLIETWCTSQSKFPFSKACPMVCRSFKIPYLCQSRENKAKPSPLSVSQWNRAVIWIAFSPLASFRGTRGGEMKTKSGELAVRQSMGQRGGGRDF
ncbi:uncharacterized protein LOC125500593 [Athalia rosae]|uniref:uncharacterized protein LOC125500593 n=1 Tax=Athalia rosae TaxID=37344 RepID=UPI0020332C33|nr:uncharacterized protein LOC125500593 [Athalia rosae]